MKKLATIALIIALTGVAADAAFTNQAFITFTSRPLALPNDGVFFTDIPPAGPGPEDPVALDPTGLIQYTFFLNDEAGKETNAVWAVIMDFTSSDGSGIYNISAFGGFVPVDNAVEDFHPVDNPTGLHNPYPGQSYNREMDSWLHDGFDWLAPPITHNIAGPHNDFMPVAEIAAGGTAGDLPSGIPFLQLVSDGNIEWNGGIARGSGQGEIPSSGTTAGGTDWEPGDGIIGGRADTSNNVGGPYEDFPTWDPRRTGSNQGGPGDARGQYEIGPGGDGQQGGLFGIVLEGGVKTPEHEWNLYDFATGALLGPIVGMEPESEGNADVFVSFAELAALGATDRTGEVPYVVGLQQIDGSGIPVGDESEILLLLPEPTTMGLMLFGSIALISRRKRRG